MQQSAWIRANDGKSLSRPARSKVEKCTRCETNCWAQGEGGALLKLVVKKGRGRNYRSKMRCKTCGCAECVARRPPKDTHCDAEIAVQSKWLSLNGDKLPARPSRSKAKSCLRCAKNCWRIGPETRKKFPDHLMGGGGGGGGGVGGGGGGGGGGGIGSLVGGGGGGSLRKTRRSVRRCKICGCAECSGRSSGICTANDMDQLRWKDANGGKELIRPARSKVEICTRCGKKCWTKKPTPKRKRGRRSSLATRNHRRCKQCGCANCDGKTSGVCTGTDDNHRSWRDANDTITLTRPSRSKVTRCTRCNEPCWVNDGSQRKRLRSESSPTTVGGGGGGGGSAVMVVAQQLHHHLHQPQHHYQHYQPQHQHHMHAAAAVHQQHQHVAAAAAAVTVQFQQQLMQQQQQHLQQQREQQQQQQQRRHEQQLIQQQQQQQHFLLQQQQIQQQQQQQQQQQLLLQQQQQQQQLLQQQQQQYAANHLHQQQQVQAMHMSSAMPTDI
jgi:hypothetical protein